MRNLSIKIIPLLLLRLSKLDGHKSALRRRWGVRHAQAHWLRIQASEAVGMAMGAHDEHLVEFVELEVAEAERAFGDLAMDALRSMRESQLILARDALIKAELLHRKVVGRSGGGE